jgi:hypothetical protein
MQPGQTRHSRGAASQSIVTQQIRDANGWCGCCWVHCQTLCAVYDKPEPMVTDHHYQRPRDLDGGGLVLAYGGRYSERLTAGGGWSGSWMSETWGIASPWVTG